MNIIERRKEEGNNEPLRGVIYARFSSTNQRDESIDAQERAIKKFAQKYNIVIAKEYIDRAKSATTADRPEFQRMIKDSAKGDFQVVLVHKLDRFARNRYDSLVYRAMLQKNHVELISISEPYDENAPASSLMLGILEVMNEFYSKNLAIEVRKGLEENALKCIHTGGTPPLGYEVDKVTRRLVINEEEAEAVRMIFQLTLYGHGYSEIIKQLTEKGYKTKAGEDFGKNSLYEILCNPKYKGVYFYNRSTPADPYTKKRNSHRKNKNMITIPNGVPAIISEEDFNRVQEILRHRKQHYRGGQEHHEQYLLTGKIFCGKCGHTYTGNRKKSKGNKAPTITYRCNNQARRTGKVCGNREVNRDYIESFVIEQIEHSIFNERMADEILVKFEEHLRKKTMEMSQIVHRLEDQMKQKIDERGKWAKALVESETSHQRQIALEEMERLDKEKADLQGRIEQEKASLELDIPDRSELEECYRKAQEMFKARALKNMKALVDLYVEKVIVHEDEVEVILNLVPLLYRQNFTNDTRKIKRNRLRDDYGRF